MEPLHLTEANRECVRELVRKITPHFEEEMWERINLRMAEERKKREEAEFQMQQMAALSQSQTAAGLAALAGQQSNVVPYGPYGTLGSTLVGGVGTTITSGYANITTPLPSISVTQATAPPSQLIYTSSGTGFTSYDPVPPMTSAEAKAIMGLGKKGSGWTP